MVSKQSKEYSGTTGDWMHVEFSMSEWNKWRTRAKFDPHENTRLLNQIGFANRDCVIATKPDIIVLSQLKRVHSYYRYSKEKAWAKENGMDIIVRSFRVNGWVK